MRGYWHASIHCSNWRYKNEFMVRPAFHMWKKPMLYNMFPGFSYWIFYIFFSERSEALNYWRSVLIKQISMTWRDGECLAWRRESNPWNYISDGWRSRCTLKFRWTGSEEYKKYLKCRDIKTNPSQVTKNYKCATKKSYKDQELSTKRLRMWE